MNIEKDTPVEKILQVYPGLSRTFIELGLPCLVCGEAFWGTIEELATQNSVKVDHVVRVLKEKQKELDEKI